MSGFVDAKDIEEGGNDSHNRHIEDARDEQAKEQLRDHMQGMGCKRTVIHLPVTYNQQDGSQDVGESETVGP